VTIGLWKLARPQPERHGLPAAHPNYNVVVRQGDTPMTGEKVEQNVSFVTKEH
jgi:hypothetical protein